APIAAQDTVRLPELQAAAVARDARAGQIPLQTRAHELRLRNLRTERLPQLELQGESTYQSDVTELPLQLPGADLPTPARTRYQVALNADQLLYDGGALGRREAVERARRVELEAEVHA